MKTRIRVVLFIVGLLCSFTITSFAAMFPSNKIPLLTYAYKKIYSTPIYGTNVSTSYYVDPRVDLVTILELTNDGWALGEYPNSKGQPVRRWFRARDIVYNTSYASWEGVMTSGTNTYRVYDGNETLGSVDNQEQIQVVGECNGRYQIIYSVTGTNKWKMGWVPTSYVRQNVLPKPVISGDFSYWNSVVGQSITNLVAIDVSSEYYRPQVLGRNPFKKSYTDSSGKYHDTNCTWYAIGRFAQVNGQWLGVTGNPNQWITQAQNKGFATGNTPAAKSVAISSGHVMFVEACNGNEIIFTEANTSRTYVVQKMTVGNFESVKKITGYIYSDAKESHIFNLPAINITDGWYVIKSAVDTNKVATMNGSAMWSPLVLKGSGQSGSQKWYFQKQPNGCYYIVNDGGLIWNVDYGRIVNGNKINVGACEKNDNQYFKLYKHPSGNFVIKPLLGMNHVVDLYGGYTADNTAIQVYEFHGESNQQWKIEPVAIEPQVSNLPLVNITDGWYTVNSALAGDKVLTMDGSNIGANVCLSTNAIKSNQTSNQRWYFERESNSDLYTIKNEMSGVYLSVAGNTANNEVNIQGSTKQGSSQYFRVYRHTNGNLVIKSYLGSNYVVDVYGGHNTDGTNVQVYRYNEGLNQQWILKSVLPYIPPQPQPIINLRESRDIGGWFNISEKSNSAMFLTANDAKEWAQVMVKTRGISTNGRNLQNWYLEDDNDGVYRFMNGWNGYLLNVDGGKIADGTKVNVGTNFGIFQGNQGFRVYKSSDDAYVIKPAKGLDYALTKGEQGVFLARFTGAKSQFWNIKRIAGIDLQKDVENVKTAFRNKFKTIVTEKKNQIPDTDQLYSNMKQQMDVIIVRGDKKSMNAIPDDVYRKIFDTISTKISQTEVKRYETGDENALTKSILEQICSDMQKIPNQNISGYIIDYSGSIASAGLGTFFVSITKDNNCFVMTYSNINTPGGRKALMQYKINLANLNSDLWRKAVVAFVSGGFDVLNSPKNVNAAIDLVDNIIGALATGNNLYVKNVVTVINENAITTGLENLKTCSQLRKLLTEDIPNCKKIVDEITKYKEVLSWNLSTVAGMSNALQKYDQFKLAIEEMKKAFM